MEFAAHLERSAKAKQDEKPKSTFKFGLFVGGLVLGAVFLMRRTKKKKVRFADEVSQSQNEAQSRAQLRAGNQIVEEDARGNQRLAPRVYAPPQAQPQRQQAQSQEYSPGFDEEKWLASLPPPDMGMGGDVNSYIENERQEMEESRKKHRGRGQNVQDDEHQVFNIGEVDFPLE
jgi:hypothetical protein